MSGEVESDGLSVALAWIGGLAGAAVGYEFGGRPAMFGLAVLSTIIGYVVGQTDQALEKWLIFLATCVAALFVNSAVRGMAWYPSALASNDPVLLGRNDPPTRSPEMTQP